MPMHALPLLAALLGLSLQPSQEQARATSAGFRELRGFATVVVTHLNATLGTENLPAAQGTPVPAGLLVVLEMERVHVFDHNVATLQQGRVRDAAPDPDCKSGCPRALFKPLQGEWLRLAQESRAHSVEIPSNVLLAAHRDLPGQTLVQAAYAVAESRPIQPPNLSLLTNGGPAGLRGLPFHLVRPGGLGLPPGSQGLGLTVTISGAGFTVTAADRGFGRTLQAADLPKLVAILKDIHKHYPGKEVIVYRFADGGTVGKLVEVVAAVRDLFPRVVLNDDEPITVR